MNIVMITTGMRPELLVQSLCSLADNASRWDDHHLTLVIDGHEHWKAGRSLNRELPGNVLINTSENVGASRVRNIGASSIPKYRRQEHVLFLDDDVYLTKNWDAALEKAISGLPFKTIISPYGHPFNVEETRGYAFAKFPLLISSVAMMMRWEAFDQIGPWDEPGGPGGSEDYAISMRATENGYYLAVTDPHAAFHTGLTSSSGGLIVGAELLKERNAALERRYGLEGKVIYG